MKKILFITNNFPPISDGVGDYTYKLACALVSEGFEVSILCSNKISIINNNYVFKKDNITVYPIIDSWNRIEAEKGFKIFSNLKFDLISLQYVPFAFHKKGLPFFLSKNLKTLFPKSKWHIMFHELWVGMEDGAKTKSQLHGLIQQRIIKRMINVLKPNLINTHTLLYKYQLEKLGYKPLILPLFSNIIKSQNKNLNKNTNKIIFSIFGTIHSGAPIDAFINDTILIFNNKNIPLTNLYFVFIGNCGTSLSDWLKVLKQKNIEYKVTGKISQEEISKFLLNSNYGITTTPYLLVEKSGTVAAMLQHNLNVICVARPWAVKTFKTDFDENIIGVKKYDDGNLKKILNINENNSYYDVLTITKQLIQQLNKNY